MTNEIKIYDIAYDEMRPVTQEDVDRLQLISQCFGMLCRIAKELTIHQPHQMIDWENALKRLAEVENRLRGPEQ